MTDLADTNADLAQGIAQLNAQFSQFSTQFEDWLAGTLTGGAANAAGTGAGPYYPVTDAGGTTRYVICPAGIAANPGGASTPLTASTIDGLAAAATNPATAALIDTNPAWAVSVDAGAGARALKKVNFFPARRTADLQALQTLLGTEVLPALSASGEASVSLGVLGLGLTGVINPKLAPYNCKGDVQEVRDAALTANSNVVYSPSGQFAPGDVGKTFSHTKIMSGYRPGWGTITGYIDAQHVQLSITAAYNVTDRLLWGTDDTAGMQAALNAIWGRGSFSYGGCLLLPAGGYLCGPLVHGPRCSIVGYGGRTSYFVRKYTPRPTSSTVTIGGANYTQLTDSTTGRVATLATVLGSGYCLPYSATDFPLLSNHDVQDDFPCLINVGMWGAFYYQAQGPNYIFSDCYNYQTVPGSIVMNQIDPYVFFSGVRVWEAASSGFTLVNRNSGINQGIEALGCKYYGIHLSCFDADVSGLHAEANGYAGLYLDAGGGNCNLMNIKVSYNGGSGYNQATGSNMTVQSNGNNISNARLQESWGSNLVFAGGKWNKVATLALDDTGDQLPAHGAGNNPPLPYRAAVAFTTSADIYNYLFDATYGTSVLPGSYLTHAVYMEGNASQNYGRLFEEPGTTFYAGGPGPNGTTIAGGTGNYAPGRTGSTSSGGFGSTNQFTINGASVP